MLYRTRLKLFLFLGLPLLVSAGQAQGQWIPQGTNSYNSNDEMLNLPSVYVVPPNSNPTQAPQYLFNARLKSQGDNIFELMSVDELLPEQECSRAEVLNAIPELRLDMTVDEGNALVGCTATISRSSADLETGLLVNASWTGIDGVPHNSSPALYNPFLTPAIGLPSSILGGPAGGWVPTAFNPFRTGNGYVISRNPSIFLSLTSSNFGAPYITLALRENVVESYSYSPAGHTDGMPRLACGELQAGFNQLSMGDTFEAVSNTLGCDASLDRVTVSSEADQRDYQWHYVSQQLVSPGLASPGSVPINNRQNQTVSVSFSNDMAQQINMRASETTVSAQECTVESILEAAQRIQVGDVVNETSALLDCGTRSESFVSDGSNTRMTIQWRTQNPITSAFTSANRSLFVSIEGDRVVTVRVQRY